jgi:hypothetical protein
VDIRNVRQMGKLRKFVKKSVLNELKERPEEWFKAREIADEVSKNIGREISPHSISHYLKFFENNELLIREKRRSNGTYFYKIKDKILLERL